MDRNEILMWLRETDEARQQQLWSRADAVRRAEVGDEVHLRGLVEISNYCVRCCGYCGIRAENRALSRYRMTAAEIAECASQAALLGYGTVVLQAGQDHGLEAGWLADIVRKIKSETSLAVTLSLGEREEWEMDLWRSAGAARYLLRFETSNRVLYDHIHPSVGGRRSDRMALLHTLRQLGYEIGSGMMIGIPGQTFGDLADDLVTLGRLDLDMIGVGPFLPHPDTPLGKHSTDRHAQRDQQMPNGEITCYKVLALARIISPRANIPATTALATLNRNRGRELGLQRGANVIMPNLTPLPYRKLYEIYPGKACLFESTSSADDELKRSIQGLGRRIGVGPGGSRRQSPTTGGTHGYVQSS